MNMMRFNPHALTDTQVTLLSTGRDKLIDAVVSSLTHGVGVRQHVLVAGPRGFGKSFFVRAVKLTIEERAQNVRVFILPEEQLNITTPSAFLRELSRNLAGRPPSALPGQFLDDEDDAWAEALGELEGELEKLDPAEVVVFGIENFDDLVASVFDEPELQSKLRVFLSDAKQISILATALSTDIDQDYEKRLFNAFAEHQLKPWSDEDHFLYFERRAVLEGKDPSVLDRGRIRALARFTGGAPRMAVALADLLLEGNPLSAAGMLDSLVDDLTPYYQNILDRMPARTRTLFDALIRQSEPCSQSELAKRVGTSQNRIAQHFAWLRERHLVIGHRRLGGKDYLYQVSDRLFVQFYRKRYLFQQSYTPLSGMAELLDGFFSADQNNKQALSLFEDGKTEEACEFIRASMRAVKGELGTWSQKSNNHAALQAFALSADGRTVEAIPYFEQAITITTAEGDDLGTAVLLGQKGLCHGRLDEIEEAIEAHQAALNIWETLERDDGQAWVLSQLAQEFRSARQFDDALYHAKLALTLWRGQGLDERVASTLGEIGENLRYMGRANEALEAYAEASDLWTIVGDNAAVGWIKGGVGLVKRQQGAFEESINSHLEAVKLLKRFKSKRPNVAYNLNWAAVSYRKVFEFDTALACDREALQIWTTVDHGRLKAMTLSSIVLNHLGLKDFGSAFDYAVKALIAAREGSMQSQVTWSASQLANLLLRQGNAEEVWQYLDDNSVLDKSHLYESVLTKGAVGLSAFALSEGRAAAFKVGRDLVEGLQLRDNQFPAHQSISYLLAGLLATETSYALVKDLATEAAQIETGLKPFQLQAISNAARLLEHGADDRLIEALDPDVSSAVRTILVSVADKKSRMGKK